eukprot:TRINITY_DN48469_c0_g1_i1.p1 TRINITY_DN48469_c0_g1~~TRINITY_DN48469_c0_g1_i1.p1  ORF type:complete len:220 (-),score=32.86 TRINITY_DN48469_c0_g1_i1:100-759(-)
MAPRAAALALLLPLAGALVPSNPKPWPPIFHAELAKNRSGKLSHTDLFYDWPGGGNLHIDRTAGEPVFFDNERQNGSTYYYSPGGSCKVFEMGVGLLPPDWLQGALYRGQATVTSPIAGETSRTCHVWEKGDAMGNFTGPFITYYEDVNTGLPARWRFFDGMTFDVLAWRPGGRGTAEEWQLPASCFGPSAAQGRLSLSLQAQAVHWRLPVARAFAVLV